MPFILTATDFSDIASKGVNYACRLASEHGTSVVVLHSYFIPIAFTDTPMPVMQPEDGQKMAEDRMSEQIQQLREFYPELDISGKVVYGDIVDTIEDYTNQEAKPWLVVLGSNGDTSWLSNNNALDALRKLPFPVLAVPSDAVYRPVHKVCFAFDGKAADNLPVKELSALLTYIKAELHLLNVTNEHHENLSHTEYSQQLHQLFTGLEPQYHFIANNNIDEAIQTFVTAYEMDWLIMVPQKHSFFESLFHKSHTAAMVRMSHIPLISLHQYK